MILVKPSHEIMFIQPDLLQLVERAGRTCYKSEEKITEGSAEKFVEMVMKRGHLSVIEHANITVKFICDRGVSHELVRHRLAAYSQESTRYVTYKGGVTFIIPPWVRLDTGEYTYERIKEMMAERFDKGEIGAELEWLTSMFSAERVYKKLLQCQWFPQEARSVLPNSLKTEIVMTANVREWLHVLKLRTSKAAHPQIRQLMNPLLQDLKKRVPVIFGGV